MALVCVDDSKVDWRFDLHDLMHIISHVHLGKGFGSDDISNEKLCHLPSNKLQELLGIINHSWWSGVLPDIWTLALIIAIAYLNLRKFPSSHHLITQFPYCHVLIKSRSK